MPMFYVYIIYSAAKNKFYTGHTEDLDKRLQQHKSTLNLGANDWEIKHTEVFNSRAEAMTREKEIKNKKSRKYIEWLITQVG